MDQFAVKIPPPVCVHTDCTKTDSADYFLHPFLVYLSSPMMPLVQGLCVMRAQNCFRHMCTTQSLSIAGRVKFQLRLVFQWAD